MNQKSSMILGWAVMLGAALLPQPAEASNITLSGTINTDDAVQLFDFTVATGGSVDLRSYGYAGGTTSTGIVVPRGGFDTVLTLFNASGTFLSQNDDGPGVPTDPSTGLAADARITQNLTPGSYILALTEYDNFSEGNLADGFTETGNPNFTANPNFTTGGSCPGDMFRDISGTAGRCRNGDWTVDFSNVASVNPVASTPEPGTAGLLGLSLLTFAWMLRKRKPQRSKLFSVLLPALFLGAWSAQAQQSANPDYSSVTDILKGQRTVIQTTDLEIVYVDPNVGPIYNQITTSNSQQTLAHSFNWGLKGLNLSLPVLNLTAHMFDQPSAITITTLNRDNNSFELWLQNIANPATKGVSAWTPPGLEHDPGVNCGAVADFTQDEYDDVALGLDDGRILVMSPNSTDPSKQPATGSFRSGPQSPSTQDPLRAMAAGDFKGDGQHEIAGLTVVPYYESDRGTLILKMYTVDPQSLAVTQASSLVLKMGANFTNPVAYASIARGRFTSTNHDQLVVAYTTLLDSPRVELIDFDAGTLNAKEVSYIDPGPAFAWEDNAFFQVETGRFGLPTNPYDQIVFLSAEPGQSYGNGFSVISADPSNGKLTQHNTVDYDAFACSAGLQVGNFDHRQSVPSSPGQTELNPNAQIALSYCGQSTAKPTIQGMNIYSVDPNSLNVITSPDSVLQNLNIPYSPGGVSFAATDLQGRSYILGPPAKIVLNGSTQPSVVLAMPPMHVDWVTPVNGSAPKLLDVSAAPSGFKTSYNVDASKGEESSTSDTTSFSFGAKETVGASFSIGDLDEGEGLELKDVFTATQEMKSSVQKESGTTHQTSFKLGASTTAGDYVEYTESRFNIWVYPVIGRTVVPACTGPNCPSQPQKVPMTIQFSAPDQTSSTFGSGINIEWYQPPWEPFNVFSYPANLAQLKKIYPNFQQIATTTAAFTDQGQLSQQVTWTNGSTSSETASFDQNNSYENDLSVTGKVNFGEIGFGFEGGLDISGSQAFSRLNKSVTSYSSSTGIAVSSLGSFLDPPNYRYPLTPVIFGSAKPNVPVDSSPLNTNVEAYGLIRTAFTADLADSDAGGWWKQAYSLPDVALNRPAHWQLTTPTGDGKPDSNCLAVGNGASQIDCFGPGTNAPQTPWTSEFHFMRGFFISDAAHPGQGPQLSLARAGDQLTLQARVYDYSFKAVETTVHVDFYAQPIDGNNLPSGPSFYIGEDKLNGIPGFNDQGDTLNWTVASVHFDTTGHAGQTVAFWVLVWMEPGPDGKVTEMPGHGLTKIPSNFQSFTSLADVPAEEYSNNVGFYKVAFPILSPLGTGPDDSPSNPVPVDIGKIGLSASLVTLNQPVTVSAPLSISSSSALAVTAQFYEGDPQSGGELFDSERIAYLEANQGRDATVIYRPSSCGTHQIFVVVNKGLPNEVMRMAEPVRVVCTQ